MTGVLRSRLMRAIDAPLCAHWLLSGLVVSQAIAGNLNAQIAELLIQEQIKVLAIEEFLLSSGHWICRAVGVSGFVATGLFDTQLAAPEPFFLAKLLDRDAAGAAVFLAPQEIGQGNANGGLDLVVEYMQGGWDLEDPLWRGVLTIGHAAYVKYHRGYRLRRALQEYWTKHADMFVTAGYRPLENFELSREQLSGLALRFDTRRTLCYSDGTGPPGQTVSNAFHYAAPLCGFTPAEQRVLLKAADGLTDQEIADDLHASVNSIKQAWRTIYTRVEAYAPSVFSDNDAREKNGKRGNEKRRRVIAFVVEHPQELRPYFYEGRRRRA